MALSLTELNATTSEYWKDREVQDTIFRGDALLWNLMHWDRVDPTMNILNGSSSDIVDGGTKIRVFLEYAKSTAAAYGAASTLTYTRTSVVNAARFDWGGFSADNSINLDDKVQNSGAEALVDLATAKLNNIVKSIKEKMAASIYTLHTDAGTNNSLGFYGLADLFSTVTATKYGDIAEDDMATWAANVITTTEAISYAVLQSIWRTAKTAENSDGQPNIGVTTDALKDAFEVSLQTQQRFSDKKTLDAGFENILFRSAPIVSGYNQTAGYFDALNLRHLMIKTHQDYNFTKPEWVVVAQTAPDVYGANTRWMGQLVTNHRASHCRHTNLS